MADLTITPSKIAKEISVPSSKSHTIRAILFASFANGTSSIESPLDSPDTIAMIDAMRQFGAIIEKKEKVLKIQGFNGKPKVASDIIQCGNSGQVLRFVGALSGLLSQYTVLTGDHSIRHNRPIRPLLDGLTQLGASAFSTKGDDFAPIVVKGPLTRNFAKIDGIDSQPISGLLIASAFAPHAITLEVTNPGEKPWVALTLDWFKRLGISYTAYEFSKFEIKGLTKLDPFSYSVPGDFSSAAFPIAAAIITNSELIVNNVDMNDIQGDKAVISLLEKMGAKISHAEKKIIVHQGAKLSGLKIDINDFIDALPILAVIACFANSVTEITNAKIARNKESDRISSITKELRKMGAQIEEKSDGLVISPSVLKGATLQTYHDHRMALALTVAALGAKGESTILGMDCITKTYPTFLQDLL